MSDITTADIRAFTKRRLDAGAAPAEINRELAILKGAYSLAMKAGRLHARPYIPMLAEHNTRRGFLEPAQFALVKANLPVAIQPLLQFTYLTGWRLASECMPLEWRNIDWHGRVVRLDPGTTTNREGRTFPFTAVLEALLKAQKAEHDRLKKADRIVPLVFHRNGNGSVRCARRGSRPVLLRVSLGDYSTTCDDQPFAISSAMASRVRQRWRWWDTRQRRSIGAMRSWMRAY